MKKRICFTGLLIGLFMCGGITVNAAKNQIITKVFYQQETQTTAQITIEQAKSTAIAHAGFRQEEVTVKKCELEYEKGLLVYEITFHTNSTKYEYEIDANSGEIIKYEINRYQRENQQEKKISREQAKSIIITDLGAKAEDVAFLEIQEEQKYNGTIYEIELVYNNKKYEYEIDVADSRILSYEKTNFQQNVQNSKMNITEEKAQEIARTKAGLQQDQIQGLQTKRIDFNENTVAYKIEFMDAVCSYEYKIDAASGTILSYEINYNTFYNNSDQNRMTIEAVKERVLTEINGTAESVTFKKCDLEMEYGIWIYDIECYRAQEKFELEVDAVSGRILEFEREAFAAQKDPIQNQGLTIGEAVNMVLERVPGATRGNIKIEEDIENYQKIYEGEIKYNGYEYEFEIDAATGSWIKWEQEWDD